MHAYLFVGSNQDALEGEVNKQKKILKSKLIEFPVKGIQDVRSLGRFIRLSLNEKTVILIKDIDKASNDALNAFLKDLEEPQANLNFFLTTESIYKVVPTIISRCQIIKIKKDQEITNLKDLALNFINTDILQRFRKIEDIKGREEAKSFIEDFLKGCHALIHQEQSDKAHLASAIVSGQNALKSLNANGNVNLHLTNFAIKI